MSTSNLPFDWKTDISTVQRDDEATHGFRDLIRKRFELLVQSCPLPPFLLLILDLVVFVLPPTFTVTSFIEVGI